jgi:hypothetical protein
MQVNDCAGFRPWITLIFSLERSVCSPPGNGKNRSFRRVESLHLLAHVRRPASSTSKGFLKLCTVIIALWVFALAVAEWT